MRKAPSNYSPDSRTFPVRRLFAFWWVGLLLSMVVVVAVPQFASIVDTKIDKTFSDLDALRTGLSLYQARHQRYPSEAEGLSVLAPDFVARISRDPWGSAYAYRLVRPESYLLYSAGADGLDEGGAGDDVTTPRKKYDRAVYGLGTRTDLPHVIGYAAFALLLASAAIGLGRGIATIYRNIRRRVS